MLTVLTELAWGVPPGNSSQSLSLTEMHVGLSMKYPLLLTDINQNLGVSQILVKLPNTKFHENPFSCSRYFMCWQADIHDEANRRCRVANTPKWRCMHVYTLCKLSDVWRVAFTATLHNKIFPSYQPCQLVKQRRNQRFKDHLCPRLKDTGRWRQYVSPKRRHRLTYHHGAKTPKKHDNNRRENLKPPEM
jgi:hypothetical protein